MALQAMQALIEARDYSSMIEYSVSFDRDLMCSFNRHLKAQALIARKNDLTF
jgi:hypothetical protein